MKSFISASKRAEPSNTEQSGERLNVMEQRLLAQGIPIDDINQIIGNKNAKPKARSIVTRLVQWYKEKK